MPSLGEAPSGGAKPFWLLFWRLKKVTRRKGGTLSRRYRSNGYVPVQQNPGPLSGSHREPARSHQIVGYLSIGGERHGSTHAHQLPDPFEQLRSALNQLGKKCIIFIHVPLVLGKVAPLMTQRE